mgnify:CR=1 FL=1
MAVHQLGMHIAFTILGREAVDIFRLSDKGYMMTI